MVISERVSDETQSPALRNTYWVLLFGFFLSFEQWIRSDAIGIRTAEQGKHVCLPYFQNCARWYFFDVSPFSYGQSLLYAFLTGLLLVSALAACARRWELARWLLLIPFVWKVLYVGVLTNRAAVDFEYFHMPEVFVFLFISRRLFFLRRVFVLVYLLAATMKFQESWLVGNYFTSLELGLPLVPDQLVPAFTLGVTLFEIFSPYFLLSVSRRIRWPVVGFWTLFHLYSVILVNFRYPAHCLPLLWALFLPDPEPADTLPSCHRRDAPGWAFCAILLAMGIAGNALSQDRLHTMQGMKISVGMFDANRQCVSEEAVLFANGVTKLNTVTSRASMKRCGPYPNWFRLRSQCRDPEVKQIRWKFYSSINGGPFYELISQENACALEYDAFSHVPWIRTPDENTPIKGYPRKNITLLNDPYRDPLIYGTPSISLSPLQQFLLRHLRFLQATFWMLWASVLLFFLVRALLASVPASKGNTSQA